MASLWKQARSKYWTACFTAADGRQLKRTTKETDKRKARIIAEAWEQAESLGSAGLLTSREQLRIILEQTYQRLTGEKPGSVTLTEWLTRWLKAEAGAVADTTFQKYNGLIQDFLRFMGTRAQINLEAVTTEDFVQYREHLLTEGRSPRTVNISIRKVLKRPFQAAVNEGYLGRNPITAIRHLRDVAVEKGIFTPDQIRQLLNFAEPDWQGLILAGFYTGARLGDLARLTWSSVDLVERSISFTQKKTDTKIKIPIHPELADFLLLRSVPHDGRKPLFPKLYHLRGSGKTGLSSSFRRLMDRAGIEPGILRKKTGQAGRNVSRLSFHSLRHSFTSALANAGIAPDIRQKLTGHADAKSHQVYSHHEFSIIADAIGRLARLPKEGN